MHVGVAMFCTDYSIPATELARALEDRGFESLWLPEHSHIPLSRASPFPQGGDLPKKYYDVMDPFVVLGAVAAVTTRLKIATGICLVAQRDPIQTAKSVASVDQISKGRFIFGVGAGWNADEMANHGTDFKNRNKVMRERIEAMRAIWTKSKPEYSGEYVKFGPMMTWPKPVQKPHPKIYFGGFTTATVSRARRHHAGWMPMGVPVADMVPEQLSPIDGATDIPVSIIAPEKVELAVLDAYRQHGAERAFILLSTKPESETLQLLDSIAAFTEIYG